MKNASHFIKGLGAAAGLALAFAVPHLGCLGVLAALLMGAGAGAALAWPLAWAVALAVAASGVYLGARAYGAGPSCGKSAGAFWGAVLAGFVLAFGMSALMAGKEAQTILTAEALERAKALGVTPLEYWREICSSLGI